MQKFSHEFKEYWGEAFLRYWDFDKNEEEGIFLENLTRGLKGIKGYFICDNGHHIYRAINQMYRVTVDSPEGDMYRLKCKECNKLTYRFPEVYRYWSDKNNKSPDMYSAKPSNLKAWWVCDNGHEERRLIASVVDTYERGKEFVCDTCRSMYVKYPELEKYWSANNKEDFVDIAHGRQDVFLWVCENGHETSKTLQATISRYKTHRDYRCNECNWEPLKGSNLERYWDYEKNNQEGINIEDWHVNSSIKAWWICNKGHSISKRIEHVNRSITKFEVYKCDACQSLASVFPELLDFYSDKNKVSPNELSYGSSEKVAWECNEGHSHRRSVQSVTNSFKKTGTYNCYKCRLVENKRPDLVRLWSDKNKSISNYTSGSDKKVWWKCENGLHEDYLLSIENRTNIDKDMGCPICRIPKGEARVKMFLDNHNIQYMAQATFKGCVYKKRLRFDFYLPQYKIAIEYDGEQHFRPVEVFGGEEGHLKTKKRDEIKNNYCKGNNIKLIRIPYWDFDNINTILSKELNI